MPYQLDHLEDGRFRLASLDDTGATEGASGREKELSDIRRRVLHDTLLQCVRSK